MQKISLQKKDLWDLLQGFRNVVDQSKIKYAFEKFVIFYNPWYDTMIIKNHKYYITIYENEGQNLHLKISNIVFIFTRNTFYAKLVIDLSYDFIRIIYINTNRPTAINQTSKVDIVIEHFFEDILNDESLDIKKIMNYLSIKRNSIILKKIDFFSDVVFY
jgi:hypothetical protein